MMIRHAAALHFSGRQPAAKKRLQRLKAIGLIAERPRKASSPSVLFLTKFGFRLLRERGILDGYPRLSVASHAARAAVSERTIRHELEIMDVKASLASAVAQRTTWRLIEFSTWPRLLQFECSPFGVPTTVRPDGFIRITRTMADSESTKAFYFELDRSTEPQATLVLRANCYRAHFKSGGFAARNGERRSDFRKHPFRVLLVLKSTERRNTIAEALLKITPPILTHVWLTTFSEIVRDPLGAVWIRPIDYREALVSVFSTAAPHRSRRYLRGRVGETLIEKHIKKRQLLD